MGEIADALRRARGDLRTPPRESERRLPGAIPLPSAGARAPQLISRDKDHRRAARTVLLEPGSEAAERYRQAILRIRRALSGNRTLLVASAGPNEGKTTCACNLALAHASVSEPRRVVLVDLDLRHPSVANSLGLKVDVSLVEVLRGEAPLDAAIIQTDVAGMDVVAGRPLGKGAESLLSGPSFPRFMAELEDRYDFVLLDSAPVLVVADAAVIARQVPAWLALTRAGRTSIRDIEAMAAEMPHDKLVGAFLNECREHSPIRRYQYHYGHESDPEV